MESDQLKKALESLLFITDHPLSLAQLCKIVGVKESESEKVTAAIAALKQELDDKASAVHVVEVADGFQMGTRPAYAPFVKKLFTERMTMKLSTAAHETLSIIAYKQPLTRAEIEQIRGVEVIAALERLLEKGLIKVVGRKETVGRPLMYGTTPDFLRHFGLRSLEDLPPIDSFTVEAPVETPRVETIAEAPVETTVETTPQEADGTGVSAAEAAETPPEPQPDHEAQPQTEEQGPEPKSIWD